MGSKTLKKIASFALPILGSIVAPGIGTALGSTLSGAALSGIGGALGGAGGGLLSGGGIKGALTGAALGGAGGYLSNGGFSNLFPETSAALGSATNGLIGSNAVGAGRASLESAMGFGNSAASAGAGATGMSSYGTIGNLLSGYSASSANDDAEEAMLRAQQQSLGAVQPYLNAKFEPGDLTQDPGYQFRLQQGQQSIDRSLGARGSLFSGAALKAGQDYGQGLADSTYNDAYNRWLAQNGQNLQAAGMATNIYDNTGNIQANASTSNSNVLNKTLSGLFGNGAFGTQGQSLSTGGLTPDQLALLLAQNKSGSIYG